MKACQLILRRSKRGTWPAYSKGHAPARVFGVNKRSYPTASVPMVVLMMIMIVVLVGLTEARLGDVIPLHSHDVLPGCGRRRRSGGRGSVAADGRGDLAHCPVHHPSECLHRHVFLFVCFRFVFSPAADSCCSVPSRDSTTRMRGRRSSVGWAQKPRDRTLY